MDLSSLGMPADLIPIIGKDLFFHDNKFKFNQIFEKNIDNKLNKLSTFFFGGDDKWFKFINNYHDAYEVECKEIDLNPLIDSINNSCSTQIKKMKLFYNPHVVDHSNKCIDIDLNHDVECYDENDF